MGALATKAVCHSTALASAVQAPPNSLLSGALRPCLAGFGEASMRSVGSPAGPPGLVDVRGLRLALDLDPVQLAHHDARVARVVEDGAGAEHADAVDL